MRVLISLLVFVGVATALPESFVFPEDAEGQEILWQETMTAILKFKEEFQANNPGPLQDPVWETVVSSGYK